MREHKWLLPLDTTAIEILVESPVVTNRKQAWVVVSSELMTAWAAEVTTPGGVSGSSR